jgi:hypothetical protein
MQRYGPEKRGKSKKRRKSYKYFGIGVKTEIIRSVPG